MPSNQSLIATRYTVLWSSALLWIDTPLNYRWRVTLTAARLIANQVVAFNPLEANSFFASVREMSVRKQSIETMGKRSSS
jgi:hypothetical protein